MTKKILPIATKLVSKKIRWYSNLINDNQDGDDVECCIVGMLILSFSISDWKHLTLSFLKQYLC